ncbi:MAG: hypothetical protein ACI9IT_001406 [Glaciecola sp.]|jgi:hypothetical protein
MQKLGRHHTEKRTTLAQDQYKRTTAKVRFFCLFC